MFTAIGLFLVGTGSAHAQKQTFDVASFNIPEGWKQEDKGNAFQLSITDQERGVYALAILTASAASTATAKENFNSQWNNLKGTVKIIGEPIMETPEKSNGWEIVSGSAYFTEAADEGLVTLASATGHGRTLSLVLMTNTKQFQDGLVTLLNSFELGKPSASQVNLPSAENRSNPSALIGLWIFYNTESSGLNSNGFPMLTGGYMRREYLFKADGTYVFR